MTLPEPLYHKLTRGEISQEECIEASFLFLLDREPKEAILEKFELSVIGRYFPDFESQFQKYVKS